MKIVTYIMRFGGRGRVHWTEILDQFEPEIFLVQETYEPQEHLTPLLYGKHHEKAIWRRVESSGEALDWGSAVFVQPSTATTIELPDFSGWVVGAEVPEFQDPNGIKQLLRVFSLHAPTGMGSYQRVVNSILDMLLNLRDGCEVIIGGDFNLTVSERHPSEDRVTEVSDLKIQKRLRDEFRLINCWQTANQDVPLAQTLRWGSDRTIPFHCDGLFVPQSWASQLRSCSVPAGGIWDDLSDHNPIVADFDERSNTPILPY